MDDINPVIADRAASWTVEVRGSGRSVAGCPSETGLFRSWLSGILYNVGQFLHPLLVFATPAAVKAGRKYGDNLQHILRQLFLEGRLVTLVDDNHFAVERETPKWSAA